MSDTGQRGRLVHNEQCVPFYGSVAFENVPNLHAGLTGLRVEGEVAQVLVVSQPPPLAFLVFLLSFPPGRRPLMGRRPRRRLNGSHTIPQLLHELVVAIGFQYVIQMRNFWGAECFLGDIMHPHLLLLAFQWFCVKPL